MNKKAIAMLSGGLDSILAAKVVKDLGIELLGLHFVAPVYSASGSSRTAAQKNAAWLGIPLKVIPIKDEFLEIIKNPKYGYGSQFNPCIDCRILSLRKAKEYMDDAGASFIVTGEVLGERPMSQRRGALTIIDQQTGLGDYVLRPLCARHMAPTLPEREGIVDRERLLGIQGRSRKPQFALAEKYGITEYSQPAGGCLLTDPAFARRLEDLSAHDDVSLDNIYLLKLGRHFRLGKHSKAIIGRNEQDNQRLEALAKEGDIMLEMRDSMGPLCIIKGDISKDDIEQAASIMAKYSKERDKEKVAVSYGPAGAGMGQRVVVSPAKKKLKPVGAI
jgi:tRNA U34 2-thiouridine synthase MnmA/TrmU